MTAGIKANVDGSAAIQVGGVDAITLTSAGAASFVTSPMTIQGGSASAPSLTFSGDTNTGIFSPAADTIAFTEGGVESMRIDANANLSVGMTSANERLNLYSANFTYIGLYNSTTGTAGTDGGYIGMSNAELEIRNKENNIISLWTNNTERARIDSSGNLFLGTTSSGIGTARFYAWSDGTNTAINAVSTGNGASSPVIKVYSTAASGATNALMLQFLNSAAGGVGSITSNGTSTAYNPSSDRRLKENIQPMTDGLARVMKLTPVTYNWKADGSIDDGFIAQDLQEIPEFSRRVNPVGEHEGETYYGVDYMRFVSVLTAAIQELKAELDATKAEVALLKGAA